VDNGNKGKMEINIDDFNSSCVYRETFCYLINVTNMMALSLFLQDIQTINTVEGTMNGAVIF